MCNEWKCAEVKWSHRKFGEHIMSGNTVYFAVHFWDFCVQWSRWRIVILRVVDLFTQKRLFAVNMHLKFFVAVAGCASIWWQRLQHIFMRWSEENLYATDVITGDLWWIFCVWRNDKYFDIFPMILPVKLNLTLFSILQILYKWRKNFFHQRILFQWKCTRNCLVTGPYGLSLWQARQFGTHCQSTWETRPSAETVSENSWKRFCLQRTAH